MSRPQKAPRYHCYAINKHIIESRSIFILLALQIMANITNPSVPKGSTVLITGVNGFLASHIADQFLQAGYKVRATVRDPSKATWVVDLFGRLYGKDNFELVAVPEMEVEGAFDDAVKGKHSPTTTILSPK